MCLAAAGPATIAAKHAVAAVAPATAAAVAAAYLLAEAPEPLEIGRESCSKLLGLLPLLLLPESDSSSRRCCAAVRVAAPFLAA